MTAIRRRTCVACRRRRPQGAMARLVRGVDGRVDLDGESRSEGRGAYVCRTSRCTDQAADRGAATVRRALRGGDPDDILAALDRVATTDQETDGDTEVAVARRST